MRLRQSRGVISESVGTATLPSWRRVYQHFQATSLSQHHKCLTSCTTAATTINGFRSSPNIGTARASRLCCFPHSYSGSGLQPYGSQSRLPSAGELLRTLITRHQSTGELHDKSKPSGWTTANHPFGRTDVPADLAQLGERVSPSGFFASPMFRVKGSRRRTIFPLWKNKGPRDLPCDRQEL